MTNSNKRLTLSLSQAEWDAVDVEAKAAGKSIGGHARAVVLASLPDRPTTTAPLSDWQRVQQWCASLGITSDMLKEHGCETKTDAVAWARTQGFK